MADTSTAFDDAGDGNILPATKPKYPPQQPQQPMPFGANGNTGVNGGVAWAMPQASTPDLSAGINDGWFKQGSIGDAPTGRQIGMETYGLSAGNTGTPQWKGDGQAPQASSGADPWAGIDPRLADLYKSHGIQTPGAAGSGFTDAAYWNKTLNGGAGGDWNYISNRLGADLEGRGTDQPGPGDTGNMSGGGFTSGGAFGPQSSWSADPRTNDLYNLLKGRATQSLDVNRHDPIIAGQTDAFNAAQTRAERNHLADLAERGGGTANLNLERRMGDESVGQNTAAFQAQLMGNELSARRQEIAQALSGMGGLLSDQQRLELQNQLALMDNMLGRNQLAQNAYQFDTNTNARYQGF